jgi:glycosyltransferase involved in cell wall biosynthesis
LRIAGNGNARFVAVSEAIVEQWSPITSIATTIANGIDLSGFSFCDRPADDPYAIWYGRIVPEKGLHLAMDAAELLGIQLRFAGPISDQAYFDKEITPRLKSSTIYCGHLPHAALATIIGGARVFLCTPCWQEPYGLVVAESLACGVPVAAFAMGGIPEILDASSGVLATPGDVESLADAARRAQRLVRADCRRRAEAVCNVEVMVDDYEDAYLNAIKSNSPIDQEIPKVRMRAEIAGSSDRVARPAPSA